MQRSIPSSHRVYRASGLANTKLPFRGFPSIASSFYPQGECTQTQRSFHPIPSPPPIANQTGHFPYTDGPCALSFGGYDLALNRFKSLCRDIFTFLLRVNPEVRQGRRAALSSTPCSAVPQSPRITPQVTAAPTFGRRDGSAERILAEDWSLISNIPIRSRRSR